jgi:hypothetical protein
MTMAKADHALAVFKAALNAVPPIGGPIASLIGDYVPTATERSIQRASELLRERLEALGDRIDVETVNKDEFAELFKSCYYTILRTHQESKLRAATGLIANILLKPADPDKLSYTELDHFTRCLEALSIGAIEVLGHACSLAPQGHRSTFNFDTLQQRMPETFPELLMGLVGELNALNLVHLPGVPSIRTDNYGNYTVTLTALGLRFATHLLNIQG